MSAPARRVLTLSHAVHLCPVQNTLDASAHSCRRHRLGFPYWNQAGHHYACVDFGDRYRAVRSVVAKGLNPLFSLGVILPTGPVGCDVCIGCLCEGRAGRSRYASGRNGIFACYKHLSLLKSRGARLLQGDRAGRPQAHLSPAAVALIAQHPRFGPCWADEEVKARAVSVVALFDSGLNGASAQPIRWSCHQICPMLIGAIV